MHIGERAGNIHDQVRGAKLPIIGGGKSTAGSHRLTVSKARAAELSRKGHSRVRVSKIPAQIVLAVFTATASKTGVYPALSMEGEHSIQPLAEAAWRHGDLNYVREAPLNGFLAGAAFITTHPTIFNTRDAAGRGRETPPPGLTITADCPKKHAALKKTAGNRSPPPQVC